MPLQSMTQRGREAPYPKHSKTSRGLPAAWKVLLGVILSIGAPKSQAVVCREGPGSSPDTCSLPVGLGNFQGYYQCSSAVRIARPGTREELADIVGSYDLVKGVGVGHSWWQEQFCAGDNSSAVGIVLTELNSTKALIENPTYSVQVAPDFPIQVHEDNNTVTVQAGVTQRILLDYLAAYISPKAPAGYTLPAFSWYVDQTMGGAVATGTHGSTMHYGSLSSQATRIQLALANGTLMDFTPVSPLWRAVQISVGRLGVITEVDFEIMLQQLLTRTLTNITFAEFQTWLSNIQDTYTAALQTNNPANISAALKPLDRTQLFWYPPLSEVWMYAYNSSDLPERFVPGPGAAPAVVPAAQVPLVTAQARLIGRRHLAQAPNPFWAPDVTAQNPVPALAPATVYASEAAAAILNENAFMNTYDSQQDPYDQYEVAIPLELVGDCFAKVGQAVDAEDLGEGFLVPPLIRFVNGEEAYLSMTNGGPHAFFNIEDHTSKSTGKDNTKFQKVLSMLLGDGCNGRLHWGKCGWPRYESCFDGAASFPETWCSFGCAVQELDPNGKFRSMSNVWSWAAKDASGSSVPLSSCCGPSGFSPQCTCTPRDDCTA